jgi:hypothetical protein
MRKKSVKHFSKDELAVYLIKTLKAEQWYALARLIKWCNNRGDSNYPFSLAEKENLLSRLG